MTITVNYNMIMCHVLTLQVHKNRLHPPLYNVQPHDRLWDAESRLCPPYFGKRWPHVSAAFIMSRICLGCSLCLDFHSSSCFVLTHVSDTGPLIHYLQKKQKPTVGF